MASFLRNQILGQVFQAIFFFFFVGGGGDPGDRFVTMGQITVELTGLLVNILLFYNTIYMNMVTGSESLGFSLCLQQSTITPYNNSMSHQVSDREHQALKITVVACGA